MLGTVITISAYVTDNGKSIDLAFDRIKEIENLMSKNIETSEISEVNRQAGKKPVKVSEETLNVIESGLSYGDMTEGNFDVTIGPLVNLWDILSENPQVPEESEIRQAQTLINYKDVIIDKKNSTVFLKNEGMILDLGGIAKGYAADQAAAVLKKHGVEHGFLNLGGDIAAIGAKLDGTPWKLGVQDPRRAQGVAVGAVNSIDKSVVSSGDYERVFFKDGVRFHHIIDPYTGYPTANEVISVTIISDKAIDGDALSTSVFILGVEKGMELIESLDGVDTVIIDRDKNIYISSGAKDIFTLFETDYKIVN